MQQETLLAAILGVIVFGMFVQIVALVAAVRVLRRLEGRLESAERELGDLRPRLERLGRVIDHLAEWTDEAAARLPRLTAVLDSSLDGARGLARLGGALVLKRLGPLGTAWAVWQGLKTGAGVYRRIRPARVPSAGALPGETPRASLPSTEVR